MEKGQIWVAGKGEWKNHLRIDWASPDKVLKNKILTKSKKADKTIFAAGRQGFSSPAVEAFHCQRCDVMVANLRKQTSED